MDGNGELCDILWVIFELLFGLGLYWMFDFFVNCQVVYQCVDDYWGVDLLIWVGVNNFDEFCYIFFLDDVVQFEGFKGDQYDFYIECSFS